MFSIIQASVFRRFVSAEILGVLPFWVLLVCPLASLAGTYYISPDGSNATGDGTVANPWATIRYATDRMPDDGSTLVVKDGLYVGCDSISRAFTQTAYIRAENAYQARFQSPETSTRAFCSYSGANAHLWGLEFFGSGSTGSEYVMHVSTPGAQHLTFENCIVHDSYNNDVVKINAGAQFITFRGCLVYNSNGPGDELFDINTVKDITLEDNIFLMDMEGSGRENLNSTHPYIVIKNSGDSNPSFTERIQVRRNIFQNWQGKSDQAYLLIGEDGKPFWEAQEVMVENNLMLFNSDNSHYGAFMVKGGARDITFRANTVVGHPPGGASAFAMRLNKEGSNPNMEDIVFYNNIWSDPTGGMGDFSDGTGSAVEGEKLGSNVYYNGGKAIPDNDGWRLFNPPWNDKAGVFADPLLPNPAEMTISRWDSDQGSFLSGETTIEAEFRRLVEAHARLPEESAAIDAADPEQMPLEDILGRLWIGDPDIGAYQTEVEPPALDGDLNGDGLVGSADLDIVRGNWGATVIPGDLARGDISADGCVGSADLDAVRVNWGAARSTAAVPEPQTALLLAMFVVLTARAYR